MQRRAAAGLMLAALAGCATRPPEIAAMPWISGRLALRIDADGSEAARSLSATFDLRGNADSGELRLSSPLGTQLAVALWAPGSARLISAEGERSFADLDELSRQALGEVLPLRALPDWLAGRPWRGAASLPQESGFEQLGWRVRLAGFAEGQIDVEREARPATRVRVRLER